MRRTVWAMASLMVLAACGGSPDAVGENSSGSIKTTAVGEVVATPSPTATPTAESNATTSNDTAAAADASTDATTEAADNATTTH